MLSVQNDLHLFASLIHTYKYTDDIKKIKKIM